MMGKGHAATGAALWGAGIITLAVTDTPVSDSPLLTGASVFALVTLGSFPVHGASLIPDIDHTNGTIAHSMGWPTKMLTKIVSALAGGHRQATHRIWFWLFVTAAAFGAYYASLQAPPLDPNAPLLEQAGPWLLQHISLVLFFIFTMFGQRALGAKWLKKLMAVRLKGKGKAGSATRLTFMVEAAVLTYIAGIVWPTPESWLWLPIAISVGHLSHLFADSLTTQGIYPFRDGGAKWRWPIIGDAGSGRESQWVVVMVAVYCATIALAISIWK